MKINRIYAVILRYLFHFRHSLDRIFDAFYWPTLDLLIWGLTSTYFTQYAKETSTIIVVIVTGILFWLIVWRAQYEITVNVLEELWNKNLINLFVSPLKFSEWITSSIIVGLIKASFSFSFAMLVAFLLYKIELFFYGMYFIPFLAILIMFGWVIGFFVAGLILRFGTKVQVFAWSTVWLFAPFSAIYYPVSALPVWAQKVSLFFPASYVFEGAREVLSKGVLDLNKVYIALFLNIIYLILSIIFLKSSFSKVLQRGLVKLY